MMIWFSCDRITSCPFHGKERLSVNFRNKIIPIEENIDLVDDLEMFPLVDQLGR